MKEPFINSIEYNGEQIFYEQRLAKDGEICLATKDPKKYCIGFYSYSCKYIGDVIAFVLIKQALK